MFGEHLLTNESNATNPARRGVVYDEVQLEGARVVLLILQQDVAVGELIVLLGGVDQVEGVDSTGVAVGLLEGGADDLEHRGDAGPTRNHGNLANGLTVEYEAALGGHTKDLKSPEPTDLDVVARGEGVDPVFENPLVHPGKDSDDAVVVGKGNGAVVANQLPAVPLRANANELAEGETAALEGAGKVEAKHLRAVPIHVPFADFAHLNSGPLIKGDTAVVALEDGGSAVTGGAAENYALEKRVASEAVVAVDAARDLTGTEETLDGPAGAEDPR